MNKNAKERGITIIALCVTLIVLCIIGGVSASVLTKNFGILFGSNLFKKKSIEKNAREQVDLACSTIRVAIAEAISKDGAYSAKDNSNLIQKTIINILNNYISNLDGKFDICGTEAVNGQGEIEIIYLGNDYSNACNNINSKILFTIKLEKKAIEVINEISIIIKDEEVKNESNNMINGNYDNDVISKYIDREKQIIFISAIIVIVTLILILILLLVWMIDIDNNKNLSEINKIRYEARKKIRLVCTKIKIRKLRKLKLTNYEFITLIQDNLIKILNDNDIKTKLNGIFKIDKSLVNSSDSIFNILYVGDDYKKACNDINSVITYVISLENNCLNLVKENSTVLNISEN